MVVPGKNQSAKGKAEKRQKPRQPVQDNPIDDLDPSIKEQLARSKATRVHAESARQKISSQIMDASKRLYQSLVEEGEQALDRAKKLETAAELNMLESQRELQRSQSIRQEADSYLQKVITQTKNQAQEMIDQSRSIKADAVAFRENLLLEIEQQAELELDQAQSSRVEADAYRQRVIVQTQRQVNDTLDQARLTAEREGIEIKLIYSIEARKVLAQADMIKAAAEEQLEAQRLYADAANWQLESREVLEQARSMINQASPLIGLNSGHQLDGHQTLAQERHTAAEDRLESYHENTTKTVSAASTDDPLQYGLLPESEPSAFGVVDGNDPATGEIAATSGPGLTEPKAVAKQTPDPLSAKPDTSSLLPANELVLSIESNQECRAYPFSTISQQRIINDTVGELDILVTFGPPSELAMMFNRSLDGRSLIFETVVQPQNGIGAGIATMQDLETGSIWEASTGRAISGPLVDSGLERLPSEYSFWYSWCQVHPTTEVYMGVDQAE